MPHTQENYRVGSPCTYQQPPFFLLPPIELQQPQPNAQAYYPQLISSLYGNNLRNFRYGDMDNRRKVALVDNSSSSSHQTNITDQGQGDKVDTFAQDPLRPEIPAGDATYAILELSKRYRVVSKESIDILYATKARVPAETVLN
ncbi:hypothetical protein FOXG_16264 [Fusarium oxysporum f. sp. lycopersici 4287]|uniref:Uncharacterized protein n=2 Tax=Fusarium oxysporum TaxID=5507 RepID=A0A0J9W7C4_FUSO4|nr:hypothetical protein FOXG_06896 [Fusarium oxysporum f. sp. lycopersici 4287]XP_018256685.1 hypothetical protein FOXG_16114 [Fusarium oxysporum f. sp. lycopersici 4287]XP_018256896.1 hypothetical protein FOXG_16264 [Fusarium oxysporum f. sp. lycopersici 4287]KNB04906.1 hypothetical protein FOXG_06896 [Fusarium oxysporum f. sp. lycopersici 4287]KNB18640.1 hypothetical protein FOXG_16114 [Fusarium oxysporum f. sp. lycopersici 4287]KNB18851.1 hypothetical protein FOXG_16264 [Fusarium oxysporum 